MKYAVVPDAMRDKVSRTRESYWDPVVKLLEEGKTVSVETTVTRQAIYVALRKRLGARTFTVAKIEGGYLIWKKAKNG